MKTQRRETQDVASDYDKTAVPVYVIFGRLSITAVGIAVAFYIAFQNIPKPFPRLESWQARVMYAFRWQLFSFFTFVLCILAVALRRLFTPAINPMNPRGIKYVTEYVNCLQNTLEQLVINVPAQLILASYLDSDNLRIIPVMVFLFIGGRIAFWAGYPLQRSYGFAITFLPTAAAYIFNIVFFFQSGSTFQLTEK